jgi:phosphatidylglycerol:prolipoprotein diacylglycerol transferase
MIPYPNIKPYIVKIGPLQIRWYSLMYLIGFVSSYFLVRYQVRKKKLQIEMKLIEDIYFYMIIGLIVGARLGYVLFYNFQEYLRNPLEIIAVWHGGMSFHGGLMGTLLAGLYITRKRKIEFWLFSDLIIATAPIGLGLGRLGNFINGELYGRVTDVPWAMVFPGGGQIPRHPSQLYEAFFEGIVLFIILWMSKERVRTEGTVTALFLILYGAMRFAIEFFREPDIQLGFIFSIFTMGQILSIVMIVVGILIMSRNRIGSKRV